MASGPYAVEIARGIARINEVLTVDLRKVARGSGLRMSEIGYCARRTGYKILGGSVPAASDQLEAIFAAGHLFEQLLLAGMRAAGLAVDSGQTRVESLDPPLVGHIDGRVVFTFDPIDGSDVLYGVPTLVEAKSANDNRFLEMVRKGVRLSNPDYYAQMQVYMHYGAMPQAFYLAINKNNSDVYTECIPYNEEFALYLADKARTIWLSTQAGVLPSPEYRKSSGVCRQCPFNPICPGLPEDAALPLSGTRIIIG